MAIHASLLHACVLALGLLATFVTPPARAVVAVGPEQVKVSVLDVVSSAPLPSARVDAWQQITNRHGDKKWRRIGRGDTDLIEKVTLVVDFGKGPAYFSTKPYPAGVRSDEYATNPQNVELLVGSTPVTVKDCEKNIPYGNRRVKAYLVGDTDPLAKVRADEGGVARFDLPFGNKESYVFEVKDPHGSTVALTTPPIHLPGPVDFCVETSDADVSISVHDAFSKEPMIGVRVFAWRHTLHSNGLLTSKRIARGNTGESGEVKLRIDFSRGDVEFSTKPYPREVRSEAYKDNPKKVQLLAGSIPVIVKDCKQDMLSSNRPYANLKVIAYQDGNNRRWARSRTDAGGVARFDPPFGNGESHVFKIKNPNGAGLIQTEPVEKEGSVMLCVDGQNEKPGVISGSMLKDIDNNDSGDQAMAGETVQLRDAAGTAVLDTATTDANGAYSFPSVAPGDYQVHALTPTDYVAVDPVDIAGSVSAGTAFTDNDLRLGHLAGRPKLRAWPSLEREGVRSETVR